MIADYYTYKRNLICESFDDSKKSTDFSPEQKEVLDKIRKVVDENRNKETSNLFVMDSFIDKYNTCICVISGGLNGPGKWTNYFEDLSKLLKDFEDNEINAWYVEGYNDCPDDVFCFNFGVDKKQQL